MTIHGNEGGTGKESTTRGGGGGAGPRGVWTLLWSRLTEAGPLLASDDQERRDREVAIVDALATEVSRTGYGAAGIMIAESFKPLSRIGSHLLHLFAPSVGLFLGEVRMANLACLLEDRDNLERFIRRIEQLDGERVRRERRARAGPGPGPGRD